MASPSINFMCYWFLVSCPSTPPSPIPIISTTFKSTEIPSFLPTEEPLKIESGIPSSFPTLFQSRIPSNIPSQIPTAVSFLSTDNTPSLTEEASTNSTVPSSSLDGRLRITLTYKLSIEGFNATQILLGEDNNIAANLLVGVTDTIITILGRDTTPSTMKAPETSLFFLDDDDHDYFSGASSRSGIVPENKGHSSMDLSSYDEGGQRQRRRQLAKYFPSVSPYHNVIFHDECDVIDGIHECMIVKTVVTVFLDQGEDPIAIRRFIVNGFNRAFNDGTFFENIPN